MHFFWTDTQALLSKLRSERVERDTPNISDATGEYLYTFIRQQGAYHLLELGTANGYSSIYLLEAIRGVNTAHLLTIEKSRADYERARTNLISYTDQVTLVCADASEFLQSVGDMRFDFIFIDALKSATLEHFHLCRSLLIPSGTIVVDDVVKWRSKMEDFYAYLQSENIAYEIVMTDPDDGIMIIREF